MVRVVSTVGIPQEARSDEMYGWRGIGVELNAEEEAQAERIRRRYRLRIRDDDDDSNMDMDIFPHSIVGTVDSAPSKSVDFMSTGVRLL